MNVFRRFKKISRKKKIFIFLGIIVVIFGVFFVFKKTAKPSYTTVYVEKSDIVEFVSETGTVISESLTPIYSLASGIVQTVEVKNGDSGKKGKLLFTINSTATEKEKADVAAAYLLAKSNLETAKAGAYALQSSMFSAWDVYKNLAENDTYEESDGRPKTDKRTLPEFVIAQNNWLYAENNYKKQQAVIQQAEAALHSAVLAYQMTQNSRIAATADGTVANLSVSEGQSVFASSVSNTVEPLAFIVGKSQIEIVLYVTENDVVKIQEGQDVSVLVNAVKGKVYSGKVERVDSIGITRENVVRYAIHISLLNPDTNLRSGMKADVTITTKKASQVLSVPNSAVKPYQGGRAVRIAGKNNEIEYVPVEIGIRGKEKTQIVSGLVEGQQIITALSNEQIKRSTFLGN